METETLTVDLPGMLAPVEFSRTELQAIVNQAADHGITATRRRYCPCGKPNCSDPAPVVGAEA